MLIRARSFRKKMTEAERYIWQFLRNRRLDGLKFVRELTIEPFIADFVCREKKIIVEIDGTHHGEKEIAEYDMRRTEYLEKKGYRVIRFWNDEVLKDVGVVLYAILCFVRKIERERGNLAHPHPACRPPSPLAKNAPGEGSTSF